VSKAEQAVHLIRDFVRTSLGGIFDPSIAQQWESARAAYNWTADLQKFKDANKYPGFFDRTIAANSIEQFENGFRAELTPGGRLERAAEVVYWKNFGNYKARDRIARDLFLWINTPQRWLQFVDAIKILATTTSWDSFRNLIASCGHTSGFATPLTFLAFYNPEMFPMIDRKIGSWWARRFPGNIQFTWNTAKTVISQTRQSFAAYLEWSELCRSSLGAVHTHRGALARAGCRDGRVD